jgi:hypothetical protein
MCKPLIGLLAAGAVCAAGWLSAAAAQDTAAANASQDTSVAEAARKAKAQKKGEVPAKHVWTDENLPKTRTEVPAATGEGGEQGAAEAGTPAPEAAKADGAKAPSGEEDAKKKAELEANWRQKFADAQKRLDDDQKDLDLMQREYNLKREQYYSDPNTAMREQYQYPSGRGGELNETAKKIEEKKQKIAQDKQAISDLEDQLRHEGLPPGWARP